MAEPTHYLRGVDVVVGGPVVVVEVQQVEETLLGTVFKDGQAPLHHRVVRIHEVHPVAAVIQVVLGQGGHSEHVFIAEGHSREGHVVSPHHVDLSDNRVGHQVEDSIPGPGAEETHTHEEGHDPDDPLKFRLVWREDKLQTVDFGPHYEIHCDLLPCLFMRAGLCVWKRCLSGIVLFVRPQSD